MTLGRTAHVSALSAINPPARMLVAMLHPDPRPIHRIYISRFPTCLDSSGSGTHLTAAKWIVDSLPRTLDRPVLPWAEM